jgi:small ligand-binding sensory domain FIST
MTRISGEMKIATALTTKVDAEGMARELAEQICASLDGRPVDACLLFASAHFEDRLSQLALEIHELVQPRAFIGGTAEAVIHGDHEYEGQPALALWAAHLPEVHAASFHLSEGDLARLDSPAAIHEGLGIPPDAAPHFVLLADPFSFDPSENLLTLLGRLRAAYADRPAIGGLASAGEEPGQNRLIFDGQTLRHGLVGIALWGNVRMDAVVSQGCRPIGHHMVITRAERNVIYELGGKSPLEVVKHLILDIEPRDRKLLQQRGLLVGCVINEYQKEFAAGDFLIRNPIGFDEDSGAMAVNDLIRTGQTVQFHVRDGHSATEDLEARLSTVRQRPPAGALLFTCNGRGTRLFNRRDHDARMVYEVGDHIPVAGCFCAGEIGPIGQRNFLHGHTASIGFFRPAKPDAHA